MVAPTFSSCGRGEVHVGRIQSHVTWYELSAIGEKYSFILGGFRRMFENTFLKHLGHLLLTPFCHSYHPLSPGISMTLSSLSIYG